MPPSAPPETDASATAIDAPDLVVTAYFGTSHIDAAAILEGGRFQPRHGEEQYLGTGIYFFVDSPEDAVRWAQQRSPHEWAVLRCAVRPRRCLDLHTRTGGDLLTGLAAGLGAVRHEPVREADAIKLLARFTVIDTVRAIHRRPKLPRASGAATGRLTLGMAGPPLPPASSAPVRGEASGGAGERNALQTILCVRNLACIEQVETFRIGS